MNLKKFLVIFFIIIAICVLMIIQAFASYEYIEADKASNWTLKYFTVPILLVMAPTSYFIYTRFLKAHETKEYDSEIWTNLRTIFRIFILTVVLSLLLFATTLSFIILTNESTNPKVITLNATIVDYYTYHSKGRTRHYIKIKDDKLGRIIKFKVDGPYKIGEPFNRTMYVGNWGLLYSK